MGLDDTHASNPTVHEREQAEGSMVLPSGHRAAAFPHQSFCPRGLGRACSRQGWGWGKDQSEGGRVTTRN
eukprot:216531-Rhodomonas_salina.1